MQLIDAEKAGVQAHRDGMAVTPVRNGAFMSTLYDADLPTINTHLDAYIHGWTVSHLAEDCDDETMPSVLEVKRIMGE